MGWRAPSIRCRRRWSRYPIRASYAPIPATHAPIPGATFSLPLVGGTRDQTIRLAVVRLTPRTTGGTAWACRGEVHFHDAVTGNRVGGSQLFNLDAGKGMFLDLNMNGIVTGANQRAGIVPCMGMLEGTNAPDPDHPDPDHRGCVASVQVYDQLTGWTAVHVGGAVHQPPDPVVPAPR